MANGINMYEMKNIILLFLFPIILLSQEVNKEILIKQISDLKSERAEYETKIFEINSKIDLLKEDLSSLDLPNDQSEDNIVFTRHKAWMKEGTERFSKVVTEIPKGDEILVIESHDGFSKIKYKNYIGFIYSNLIVSHEELNKNKTKFIKTTQLDARFSDDFAVAKYSTKLKFSPDLNSETIGDIQKGDSLIVIDREINYYKVQFGYKVGYAACVDIKSKYETQHKNLWLTKQDKIQKDKENKRVEEITKKFGKSNGSKIAKGIAWIGMTDLMAKYSWGEPEKINQSLSARGKNEQWVYGNGNYLYFDNGILTNIQTSE